MGSGIPNAPPGAPNGATRSWLRFIAVPVLLLCVTAAALYLQKHRQQGRSEPIQSLTDLAGETSVAVRGELPSESQRVDRVASKVAGTAENNPASGQPNKAVSDQPAMTWREPSPETRQLVGSLSRLDKLGEWMTGEETAEWKQNLQQLVKQGADAVPGIMEFLKQNKDVEFGAGLGEALGYPSARRAMFDALAQIGGADGVAGMLQTLQNTADPRELAILAQNLEKVQPEQHREEVLQAARETLALAASGKLEGSDVGPLFEVLQKYGGSGISSELEQNVKQWNYYGSMALAQLPDGAGIPALIQLAQGDTASKGTALEMLAQTSAQYPEARAALLDMVHANKVSPNQWPYLAPMLAGEQYYFQDCTFEVSLPGGNKRPEDSAHVVFGNQHFYTAPAPLTPEQINQRMAFLDDVRALTSDPAALQALEHSRDLLMKRLPQTVAVSP